MEYYVLFVKRFLVNFLIFSLNIGAGALIYYVTKLMLEVGVLVVVKVK